MTPRRARTLAGGSFAVSALLCAGAAVFLVLGWDTPLLPNEFGVKGYGIAFSLVIGGIGAVIAARRPANPIGWTFCGLGVLAGVLAIATEYPRWALIDQAGRPPAGLSAAWIEKWVWILVLIGGTTSPSGLDWLEYLTVLSFGAELHTAAAWPDDGMDRSEALSGEELASFAVAVSAFPVRHQGELLGALTVKMPASEPLGPAQHKLLGDVAAQAALVVRNVALLEDLRASRKRIVTSQNERGGEIGFEIRDDGVGFDPAEATGSGLANMRDRLEALGGSVEIRSTAGNGTIVRGLVPAVAESEPR